MRVQCSGANLTSTWLVGLPDGHLWLGHEELRNLAAYVQALKLGKEFGLDAVRLHSGELMKGEILPGQAYVGAR